MPDTEKTFDPSWKSIDTLPARLVGNVSRCRNLILSNDKELLAKSDLTWQQFLTLSALRGAGQPYQLQPTDLYQATQMSSGGLTKLLYTLEKRGLIERSANKEDKRSTFVSLTPAGKALIENIVDQLVEANGARFNQALNKDELNQLVHLLDRLQNSLK